MIKIWISKFFRLEFVVLVSFFILLSLAVVSWYSWDDLEAGCCQGDWTSPWAQLAWFLSLWWNGLGSQADFLVGDLPEWVPQRARELEHELRGWHATLGVVSGYVGLAITQSLTYDFFPLIPRSGGRSVQVLTDWSHLQGAVLCIICLQYCSQPFTPLWGCWVRSLSCHHLNTFLAHLPGWQSSSNTCQDKGAWRRKISYFSALC